MRAEVPDIAEAEDGRVHRHHIDAYALDDPSAKRRVLLGGFAKVLMTERLVERVVRREGRDVHDQIHVVCGSGPAGCRIGHQKRANHAADEHDPLAQGTKMADDDENRVGDLHPASRRSSSSAAMRLSRALPDRTASTSASHS